MESRAKLFGHALHQQLVVFPLGLLVMSLIFDLIRLATGDPVWSHASYLMIAAGVITGLIAAIPGVIDWSAIPSGTRAKSVATWHGLGNVLLLVLFGVSWVLRSADPGNPGGAALVLAIAAVAVGAVTGWLGGELVGRLGVGVDENAHLNAPSSLKTEDARPREARRDYDRAA